MGSSRRGADKENCGRAAYPAILTPQGPYAPTCFIQCTRSNATIFVADVSAGSTSPELNIPRLWDRGETPRINELGQMMKTEDNLRDFSCSSSQQGSSESEEDLGMKDDEMKLVHDSNSKSQENNSGIVAKQSDSCTLEGHTDEDGNGIKVNRDNIEQVLKSGRVEKASGSDLATEDLGVESMKQPPSSTSPPYYLSVSLEKSSRDLQTMPQFLSGRTNEEKAGNKKEVEQAVTRKGAANFTPRRAQSMAESDAAKEALNEARAMLERLAVTPCAPPFERPSPSHSISHTAAVQSQNEWGHLSPVLTVGEGEAYEETYEDDIPLIASLPEAQLALAAAYKEIRRLHNDAKRADQLEVTLHQLRRENECPQQSSTLYSTVASTPSQQDSKNLDERRKLESKIRFLEGELEGANAELSLSKAKLSSTDIELQVLRAQFEKIDHRNFAWSLARGRGIHSSCTSTDLYSSTTSSECKVGVGVNSHEKELEAELDVADAERRTLERSVKLLQSHNIMLQEENLALHQSLQDALYLR